MHDQPTAAELLEAIAAFLSEEVIGALKGRARFHALVAANSAAIVGREIELGPASRAAELRRLRDLLGEVPENATEASEARTAEQLREANHELCRRIDAGEADTAAFRRAVLDHLRLTVADQLAIDNPGFDRTVHAE